MERSACMHAADVEPRTTAPSISGGVSMLSLDRLFLLPLIYLNTWVDGWMDGWVDGWVGGWDDKDHGEMDRWTGG